MQRRCSRSPMRVLAVSIVRIWMPTSPIGTARPRVERGTSAWNTLRLPSSLAKESGSRWIPEPVHRAVCDIRRKASAGWSDFTAPCDAIPVDLFRILVSLNSAAYFARLARESPRLYGPTGLLDPALNRELFWFSRWTPLHPALPGIGVTFFQVLYVGAAAASLALAAGFQVRTLSAGLFVTAASVFRWNIPVVYLDDAMMHAMLLWLFLLPTGRTLTIPGLLKGRRDVLRCWTSAQVPGTAVRAFLVNLALIYGVAGAWKWTSPMWRQGIALYAGLKMAVAHDPERWSPRHLPLLRIGNYGALLLETVVPLGLLLPAGHPLKRVMGAGLLSFHLGIVATLKIPFANLACIAALALVFRDEIMAFIRSRIPDAEPDAMVPSLDVRAWLSIGLVTTIAAAMLVDAVRPRWRSGTHDSVRNSVVSSRMAPGARENPFASMLWLAGVAQSYRLFDWIDERNYHITYDARERGAAGRVTVLDDREVFPRTQRDVLLQSYLHDVMWIKVPRNRLPELQRSIFDRYARQYCQEHGPTGTIRVDRLVQRVDASNLDLHRPVREPFLRFTCCGKEPAIGYARLSHD